MSVVQGPQHQIFPWTLAWPDMRREWDIYPSRVIIVSLSKKMEMPAWARKWLFTYVNPESGINNTVSLPRAILLWIEHKSSLCVTTESDFFIELQWWGDTELHHQISHILVLNAVVGYKHHYQQNSLRIYVYCQYISVMVCQYTSSFLRTYTNLNSHNSVTKEQEA